MKTMYFGMSVDDVALSGWSKVENFRKLIEFFQKEKVSATFFTVPVDEESNQPFYTLSKEYIPIMRQAIEDGFNFEQHGLRHNRFELGIPPKMILDLPHETENKRYAQENKDFLEQDHCVENCRKRLAEGRKILEDSLECKISGFRSPALQESNGMYQALKEEGYLFDSSTALQETGWDYILDKMDIPRRDITKARYEEQRKKSYNLSLPLTCDYTWYLTKEKYAKAMELAQEDFRQCMACDIPFITVAHVDPVFEGEGLNFLHELYDFAKEEAEKNQILLEFANLKCIGKKINK